MDWLLPVPRWLCAPCSLSPIFEDGGGSSKKGGFFEEREGLRERGFFEDGGSEGCPPSGSYMLTCLLVVVLSVLVLSLL